MVMLIILMMTTGVIGGGSGATGVKRGDCSNAPLLIRFFVHNRGAIKSQRAVRKSDPAVTRRPLERCRLSWRMVSAASSNLQQTGRLDGMTLRNGSFRPRRSADVARTIDQDGWQDDDRFWKRQMQSQTDGPEVIARMQNPTGGRLWSRETTVWLGEED